MIFRTWSASTAWRRKLAAAEGADLEIVRAAALLHDVEGTAPEGAGRASHHHESAEFAAEVLQAEGWPAERIAAVQHCIRAHRFRDRSEPPATLEAKVLFDADKLDVLGAIGAARTIAYAILAGQPIHAPASEQFRQTGEKEPGEPHSSLPRVPVQVEPRARTVVHPHRQGNCRGPACRPVCLLRPVGCGDAGRTLKGLHPSP